MIITLSRALDPTSGRSVAEKGVKKRVTSGSGILSMLSKERRILSSRIRNSENYEAAGFTVANANGYISAMTEFESSESEVASSNGTITFGAKPKLVMK